MCVWGGEGVRVMVSLNGEGKRMRQRASARVIMAARVQASECVPGGDAGSPLSVCVRVASGAASTIRITYASPQFSLNASASTPSSVATSGHASQSDSFTVSGAPTL